MRNRKLMSELDIQGNLQNINIISHYQIEILHCISTNEYASAVDVAKSPIATITSRHNVCNPLLALRNPPRNNITSVRSTCKNSLSNNRH